MHLRLLSLGFGNVGHALAQMLAQKAPLLERDHGLTFSFTGAITRRGGAWTSASGLSAAELVKSGWPPGPQPEGTTPFDGDALALVRACPADVVLELTTLAPSTGEPAISHLRTALELGRHAVTANKGPIAHALGSLRTLARARGRGLRFESTVMDGTPIFGMRQACLPATVISRVEGPLNSTSNFILDGLHRDLSFTEALMAAQQAGIAEATPSADLDGYDAAVKLCVLSGALMDVPLDWKDVERVGLGAEAMERAVEDCPEDHLVKQIGWARRDGDRRDGDRVEARVELVTLPRSHLFATLRGMEAALRLTTDTLGELTLIEGEGGPGQTALGLVADLVQISREFPG